MGSPIVLIKITLEMSLVLWQCSFIVSYAEFDSVKICIFKRRTKNNNIYYIFYAYIYINTHMYNTEQKVKLILDLINRSFQLVFCYFRIFNKIKKISIFHGNLTIFNSKNLHLNFLFCSFVLSFRSGTKLHVNPVKLFIDYFYQTF